MKKLIATVLAALFVVGCNTMAGVGKDVEKAGESIQNKARR
jgi:predicted small secreted protein